MNLLLGALILLAACAAPTAAPAPTATSVRITFPPTWTATPGRRGGTLEPTVSPRPTRTLAPIATPAASAVFTLTDGLMRLSIPSNWEARGGQLTMINRQSQRLEYVTLSAPGAPPQPAALIFYKWPNAGVINNENAWQQAYAVASLAVKVCPITLTEGGRITIAGEAARYIGYVDSCGVQGEVIGFVHGGVNFGILIEAPLSVWDDWRPMLRRMLATLQIDEQVR